MDKNAFTLLYKIVIFAVILQSKLHRLHPEEWRVKSFTRFTLSVDFPERVSSDGKVFASASFRSFINFRASLLRWGIYVMIIV